MNYSSYRLADIKDKLSITPLDIMVAGVTGAGKSTTLNSFFQKTIANVGEGVSPETMDIGDYRLNRYIRIWDTPGLGDSPSADKRHIEKMIGLLNRIYQIDDEEYGFIDLVLVILEGGSRDMFTTEYLLNKVIIPHIQQDRILVAINQADFAMKGHHWDSSENKPDDVLSHFLCAKANSIRQRVYKDTGMKIPLPIFYSAKYEYNIDVLFDFIIDHIPTMRRRA